MNTLSIHDDMADSLEQEARRFHAKGRWVASAAAAGTARKLRDMGTAAKTSTDARMRTNAAHPSIFQRLKK